MQNDSEAGTSTKPPKLNHINDWGWWKERLRTYVQGQGLSIRDPSAGCYHSRY
ncbi:hypothetical protein HanXRQr2_Chr17g0804331 [Helianthus annuus]|uniref:Uncharacterized protein n=1 Tax=Helianthus annuus TaxID=4232 RepID=A0A9K3DHB1_HELAN|nr:hypothetical protein HanXRQr2_Chr17g0804331 [Helianthus annuus]